MGGENLSARSRSVLTNRMAAEWRAIKSEEFKRFQARLRIAMALGRQALDVLDSKCEEVTQCAKKRNMASFDGRCCNLYATLDAHRRSDQALELTLSKERCDAYFAAIEKANK